VELSGELTTYTLEPGQTLLVHPGHVGMFQAQVQFSIAQVPGIANKLFGGDGFHLVALTGPGQVWLQSMPLPNLAHALEPYLNTSGEQAVAGGAVGGIVGNILRS
jgi:uncharacterized protein (AIM24 family)